MSPLSGTSLPSLPTPLGCYRASAGVPWVIQRIPIDCLFYIRQCICFHATLSVYPTFFFLPLLVSLSLFSMSVSPLPPCK